MEVFNKIGDDEAAKNKLGEEGDISKLIPEAAQAYWSCKEGGKPMRNFKKKHINAILLLFYGLCVSGNKAPMLAVLDEAVQKAPEKLKAPELTYSEANKTLPAEPFSEKEDPVVDQGPTEV